MALSGDDADVRERIRHTVSVSPMLVNAAVMFDKISAEINSAGILCSGDVDGR